MFVQCVCVLLKAGASVDIQDINGSTPLHNCAISGNLTSAKSLLAVSPFTHCARGSGCNYIHDSLCLLQKNANPNAKDSKGNTPLHHAAR